MATSSQVYQNKRGRDECWNGGLALPDGKLNNSAFTLSDDSDLMALLDKIENMDNNHSNLEDTQNAMNEVEGEMMLNGVVYSLEDEIGLKAQTDNDFECSTDENDSSTDRMGSNKQGELTPDGNSEATSVMSIIGNFTYYDDVRSEHDFFLYNFSPDELQIIMNHIDGNSIPDIMYSDAVHGYAQTTEVFHGSLWEDDIWQLNGHAVIRNDFESQRQEEFGISGHAVIRNDFESQSQEEFGISVAEFYDVWN